MNAQQIAALKPGETAYDDVVRGLHARAFDGRVSYYLFYRTKERTPRRPKLGDHGILTLAQARDLAREELHKVAAGRDPVAERKQIAGEPTVGEFFERVYETDWSQKKSGPEVRRIYVAYVAARLGNLHVGRVRPEDVRGLHAGLARTPYQANRVLAFLNRFFNLAERDGVRRLRTNPCRHVARCHELSRRRFATKAELAAIGAALSRAAANPQLLHHVVHVMLVLLAGARPGEIASARWDYLERLESGGAVLRLPDSKTGARDVYLPPQALELVDRLPRGDLLVGPTNPARLWRRIRLEAGCPDLRLYDLRRTFATVGMAVTKNRGLVGELLGHASEGTTMVYARLWNDAAVEGANATGAALAGLLALQGPSQGGDDLLGRPAHDVPAQAKLDDVPEREVLGI